MNNQTTSRSEYKRERDDKRKGKKKRGRIFRLLKLAFLIFLGLGVVGAIVTGIIFFSWVRDAPPIDENRLKNSVASTVLDNNGNEYTRIGTESRDYVRYDDIPVNVRDALLATEDNRFFRHNGIDIIRFGGAVMSNITSGGLNQGGSTITQQVVKMSFLTLDKNIKRKVQEMYIAYQLEKKLTKEQIFEIYFNKVNMSAGSYGIGTAAEAYFDKTLDELTIPEIAYLVGVPQSPNRYNAFTNPDLANKRKNTVLLLMKNAGKITEEEMNEAKAVDISTLLRTDDRSSELVKKSNSFIDAVIREVSSYGDYDIFSDGLIIHTTLDPQLQEYVEYVLESNEVVEYPDDEIQSGIVLIDTGTSEVRALGGWRKTDVERGFNYATSLSSRQPGSTIKPILSYAPAVENIHSSSYWEIIDEPFSYSDSNKTPVRNANSKFSGSVSMRTALENSLNVPAVKTIKEVGLDKARDFALNLGIELEDPIGEAAAIGGVSKGPSPYELAGAYAAFGNNGVFTKPHTITKIEDLNGNVKETVPESKEVMKASTAYIITDVLKGVPIRGTGKSGNVAGLPMAAKTGTTNYTDDEKKKFNLNDKVVPDSWYVGYTTEYTLSVWTGYPERKKGLTPEMQKISALAFKAIMEKASGNVDTKDFEKPSNLSRVSVVAGKFPAVAASTTGGSSIVEELFEKGQEPRSKATNSNVQSQQSDDEDEEDEDDNDTQSNNTQNDSNNSQNQDRNEPNILESAYITYISGEYDDQRKMLKASWNVNPEARNSELTFSVAVKENGNSILQKLVTDHNITIPVNESSKYSVTVSIYGGNSTKTQIFEFEQVVEEQTSQHFP